MRRKIKLIKDSGFIDEDWYREQYQDVDYSKISPAEHYLTEGWLQGKNPSVHFSTSEYLEMYDDVEQAGVNPLLHYVLAGQREGRKVKGQPRLVAPRYSLSIVDWSRLYFERVRGRSKYAKEIEKNANARILVCLHLFYMTSWRVLSRYLDNLAPYKYDLIVTYVDGQYDAETLDRVRAYRPDVKLLKYPNQGFDIGSFVDVLKDINLDDYDIVFKLHSKGISRKFIYIYDQIFKNRDWFLNLFNGVLGGENVHATIDKLMNDKSVGLVAADNLIIKDPIHKQHFTAAYAEKFGVKIEREYRYVAGTCFAVRAHLLKPIQDLGLTIDDFEGTARGFFSLAHGMERLVCACIEPAGYVMSGNPTAHPTYDRELAECRKYSSDRMLHDKRFKLDYEFFYKALETARLIDYEIVDIKLGDVGRRWKKEIIPLSETHPYKYLKGEVEQYEDYVSENQRRFGYAMSVDRFTVLKDSVNEGFDPLYMPVIDEENCVRDGQHRMCLLLHKYGPEHVVKAIKIYCAPKRKS